MLAEDDPHIGQAKNSRRAQQIAPLSYLERSEIGMLFAISVTRSVTLTYRRSSSHNIHILRYFMYSAQNFHALSCAWEYP